MALHFLCKERPRKQFSPLVGLVKLVHVPLSVRKGIENNFHNYGGPVKLMHASLCVRQHTESSFHHCTSPMKLMHACLCVKMNAVYNCVEVL